MPQKILLRLNNNNPCNNKTNAICKRVALCFSIHQLTTGLIFPLFMQLHLQHIIPFPLRDRLASRHSDIWGREMLWSAGDKVQIIAPSGTGKTTLVHVLWNLRHDYAGTMQYDGTEVRQISPVRLAEMRQQELAVVFQDLRLFPKLTGRENIELKRNMSRKPFCSSRDVEHMAERLGVANVLHQTANTCSYGEQQRIAIIRALVQPFSWLIMDEPFSHLDKQNTAIASQLITEACHARGAGFVLTDLDGNTTLICNKTFQL